MIFNILAIEYMHIKTVVLFSKTKLSHQISTTNFMKITSTRESLIIDIAQPKYNF